MAKPDLNILSLPALIASLSRRLDRIERREAFIDKRTVIANAGGFYAQPVPLVAPDASGWYSVTSSTFADMAVFVGGSYGGLWVIAAGNGTAGQLHLQITYPAGGSRVLATSTLLETHPQLGPLYRVSFAADSVLAAATTAYGQSVTLQASTDNSSTSNKIRIVASGWGKPNV